MIEQQPDSALQLLNTVLFLVSENFPEFIENRHDQSIISILLKLNNVHPLPASALSINNIANPIWAMRDKKLAFKYLNLSQFLRKQIKRFTCA
jgi:hypothetical protein